MPRKLVVAGVLIGLLAGLMVMPVAAKKKPKPVATTLYMHGPSQFGEADGVQWAADGFGGESPLTLDATEPAGAQPKSMNYFSPALNDQCTGLPLGFPTFTGHMAGTIVGNAKMTLHFLSVPAKITARIWVDVPAFTCNESYIEPASEVEVDIPAGQSTVEVVFPKLKLKALGTVMIEILAGSGGSYEGQVGRLLYDSTGAPSNIAFSCIPAAGKSCAS